MSVKIRIIERQLHLWAYNVSHSVLLLISNTPHQSPRLAVLIKGVKNINIPTYFYCRSIERTQDQDDIIITFKGNDNESHSIRGLALVIEEDEQEWDAPFKIYQNMFEIIN